MESLETLTLHAAGDLNVAGIAIRRIDVRVESRLSDQIAVHARCEDETELHGVDFFALFGTLYICHPSLHPAYRKLGRKIMDRVLRRRPGQPDMEVPDHGLVGVGKAPTLELDVRVPLCSGLRLRLSGDTVVRAGDVSGPVDLRLSDGVDVEIGASLSARVEARGGAVARIASTEGDISADLSGASALRIGRSAAGSARAWIRDGAFCGIEAGELAGLDLRADGSARAELGALVAGDVAFQGSGAFDVEVGRVLGEVEASWSGGGCLRVGRPAPGAAEAGASGGAALTAA